MQFFDPVRKRYHISGDIHKHGRPAGHKHGDVNVVCDDGWIGNPDIPTHMVDGEEVEYPASEVTWDGAVVRLMTEDEKDIADFPRLKREKHAANDRARDVAETAGFTITTTLGPDFIVPLTTEVSDDLDRFDKHKIRTGVSGNNVEKITGFVPTEGKMRRNDIKLSELQAQFPDYGEAVEAIRDRHADRYVEIENAKNSADLDAIVIP